MYNDLDHWLLLDLIQLLVFIDGGVPTSGEDVTDLELVGSNEIQTNSVGSG